jgi:hypothetical protein
MTKERKLTTLINIGTVSSEDQAELVALLPCATGSTVRHGPGFISASLRRSLDGPRVATQAQWRSVEDHEAMRRNGSASPFFAAGPGAGEVRVGKV